MRRPALVAAIGLALVACTTSAGIWVVPPPPIEDEPVPGRYRFGPEPVLRESGTEGFLRAEDLDPHVYYAKSERLWYRYWRGGWYQAFTWDGNWFPPEHVPKELRRGELAPKPPPARELPTLPDLEED